MIDFTRYRKIYFLISAVILLPGVFSLAIFGLRPSVDFTGGSLWEVRVGQKGPVGRSEWERIAREGGADFISVQSSEEQQYLVRLGPLGEDQHRQLREVAAGRFAGLEEIRFETVGPTLGRELLIKTLVAVVVAAGGILVFVAYQSKDKMYGICAVLAMFHDSLILLGSFSLLGRFWGVEVDTLFVTAVLTTLSFSVHDTVVVFNSVRENVSGRRRADLEQAINQAVAETLVRSINNSMTIIFMLTALAVLGGETIRWFAVALLIGTITGTYSSTFVAAPLLLVWQRLFSKR